MEEFPDCEYYTSLVHLSGSIIRIKFSSDPHVQPVKALNAQLIASNMIAGRYSQYYSGYNRRS